MKYRILFAIFAYCFNSIAAFEELRISYKIKNFAIEKCREDDIQPISLENISVETTWAGNFAVSGTMTSSVNLDSPIKVVVNMKRYFLGVWWKVFCFRNLGSCTYPDLCQYSIDPNLPCPDNLKEHNVPCRCPIEQGNYTLPKYFTLSKDLLDNSIISGKYYARITVTSDVMELGCFDAYYTVYT